MKEQEGITNNGFAGKLYRYRRYSGEEIDHVNDLILNNRIYYSSPQGLNDPCDCQLHDLQFSQEGMVRFAKDRANRATAFIDARLPPEIRRPDPEQAQKMLQELLDERLPGVMESCAAQIRDLQRTVDTQIGVLCFTTDPLNTLMYSHYADAHSGICLEFTLPEGNLFDPRAVQYVTDYPEPRFGLDNEFITELVAALVLTKSQEWAYEKEYRSLRAGGAGCIEFPSNYLTGIILGQRATAETIAAIRGGVEQSGKALSLHKVVRGGSSFDLSLKRL